MEQDCWIADAENAGKVVGFIPVDDNGFNQDRICICLLKPYACGGKEHGPQQAQRTRSQEKDREFFSAHYLRIMKKSGYATLFMVEKKIDRGKKRYHPGAWSFVHNLSSLMDYMNSHRRFLYGPNIGRSTLQAPALMITGQQSLSRMWPVVMFMPVMHVPFPQSDAHDQQAGDYHANNKVYDQVFHDITSLKK